VTLAGGAINGGRSGALFRIDVKPVVYETEELLLVCFVDEPERAYRRGRSASGPDTPRVAALEQELKATRAELLGAIRNLEVSSEEQKAINEEALSVQEEYQSTNEELLTSKEELQSLNEELTALNSQLQETLERQRTTANDLQNVLYSTDVATLFLDKSLSIRFFTPAMKALFAIIPSDIGRPLSDLHSLAADGNLVPDAARVAHPGADGA
jgi:two-component system CheB/CheR fusion protein